MKFAVVFALVAFLAIFVAAEDLENNDHGEQIEQFEPVEQLRLLARFSEYLGGFLWDFGWLIDIFDKFGIKILQLVDFLFKKFTNIF